MRRVRLHWLLADGTKVEICSWLDDHSGYLLDGTAFGRVSGDDVVATFTAAGKARLAGWPAATPGLGSPTPVQASWPSSQVETPQRGTV